MLLTNINNGNMHFDGAFQTSYYESTVAIVDEQEVSLSDTGIVGQVFGEDISQVAEPSPQSEFVRQIKGS